MRDYTVTIRASLAAAALASFATVARAECYLTHDTSGNLVYICEEEGGSGEFECRNVFDYQSGQWVVVCN